MRGAGRYTLLAALCLLAALGLTAYNCHQAQTAGTEAALQLDKLHTAIRTTQAEEKPAAGGEKSDTVTVDGLPYIGELVIDAYGMHLPVMADYDSEKLRMAPCLYSGKSPDDHMVIVGHNYNSHFGPLLSLGPGSRIDFIDSRGRLYNYRVNRKETLAGNDLQGLLKDTEDQLSLVTCTMSGYTRCVLRCQEISRSKD